MSGEPEDNPTSGGGDSELPIKSEELEIQASSAVIQGQSEAILSVTDPNALMDEEEALCDSSENNQSASRRRSEKNKLPEHRVSQRARNSSSEGDVVPGAVAIAGTAIQQVQTAEPSPSPAEETAPPLTANVSSATPSHVTARAVSIRDMEEEIVNRVLGETVKAEPAPTWSWNKRWSIIAVVGIVIVGLVVGVVVGTRDDGASPSSSNSGNEETGLVESSPSPLPSSAPSNMPMLTQEEEELLDTLIGMSFDDGAALGNRTSPQFQAFKWLKDDTNFQAYSRQELQSRYALATFYYATDGDRWRNNTNWLTEESICDWVTERTDAQCNGNDLDELVLITNALKGFIPPELALLSNGLRIIQLDSNELRGSIPEELALLTAMEIFSVENNLMTGPAVPSVLASAWTRLEQFNVASNELTGSIPEELALLTGMEIFNVEDNLMTGQAIPSVLGSAWTRLQEYNVGSNWDMTGNIPQTVGAWTDLRLFKVENTAMNGPFPIEIGQWTRLKEWWSRRVAWDGVIVSEFGLMKPLEILDLAGVGGSVYGTLPEEIYDLTSLTWISLTRVGVQGTISTSVGKLSNLEKGLHFGLNRFEGTIPSEIGLLTAAQELRLNSQNLTGGLPRTIGNMTSLQLLSVQGNALTGPLPEEIGLLTNCRELGLRRNQFSGSVPNTVGNMTALVSLNGQHNELTGPIAIEMSSLVDLETFNVLDNFVTGELPGEDFWSLPKLRFFGAGNGSLTGRIPSSIGLATNLESLFLHSNTLTGPLPAELGNLSLLQQLAVSDNILSQSLPPALGALSNLVEMYVHDNPFINGSIPSEFGGLSKVEVATFDGTEIGGEMPPEVCALNITSLYADCSLLSCTCCTYCCDEDTCMWVGEGPDPVAYDRTAIGAPGPSRVPPLIPLPEAAPELIL